MSRTTDPNARIAKAADGLLGGGLSVDKSGRLRTEDGRDVAAVLLGQRGGLAGGRARAAKLSSEQRSEIARKAAAARWKQGE